MSNSTAVTFQAHRSSSGLPLQAGTRLPEAAVECRCSNYFTSSCQRVRNTYTNH
ncbi:hypothetical protein Sjap_023717 [Stephania japonica]|uniref:Uncharacterized protein n=1 Tax=Stephania japonica TaxID=461633 RepID=A0AAP0HPH2_9MAGN